MYVHQYTPRTIYALEKPAPSSPRRRSSRELLAEKEAGDRPTSLPLESPERLHRPCIARRTVSVGSSPSSSSSSSGWSEEEMELLEDPKRDTTTRVLLPHQPSTATTRTTLPNKNNNDTYKTQRNKLRDFQHHFLAMLKKEGHGKYSIITVEEYHTRIIPRYIAGLVYQNLVQTAGEVSSCQAHTWQCDSSSSTAGSSVVSKLPWKQCTHWSCCSCGLHKSFYQYELHKLHHIAWALHHDFPTSTTTISGCTGQETLVYSLPQVVRTVHVRPTQHHPPQTPEDDNAIRRR